MIINKHSILLILILSILFSGCVQQNPDSKTVYYITDRVQTATITLYPDHTFTAIYPKSSGSGTYRIDGDHVILTFNLFGVVQSFKISGNELIDEKTGDVWVKQ